MKKLLLLFLLTVIVSPLSAQDNVFSYTVSENSVTQNAENTRAVNLDRNLLDRIMSENSNDFFLKLPLINESFLVVNMKEFSVLSPEHNLIIEKSTGQESEEYSPDFRSYYILYEGNSIGTFLCFENSIVISYKHNNRQFEINKINNEFLLFDINDCLIKNSFSCQVEEKKGKMDIKDNHPKSSTTNPKCLELAVEVDQYTRNTFSSNTSATNWAHAIIAGVSQVYASEVNLNISIVSTIIWQTQDPYDSYVNDASNMLSALRNHWTANNGSISRDLVHLMTKRSNTGTGGIAYRDVLCDNSWGYGFSSDLNNTTNFNFPNPSYTWNLLVCSHEIGHNIESHHTHWCGWPGGPIDNCTDVEGSCTNNPTPQIGTIMSYCHTTSAGSLIDFHSIVVSNALNPGINGASCLTTCTFYGCTDANATNYDINATVDDGSCLYIPVLTGVTSNIICNGLSDGSINLSVTGGTPPYTYSWSNGATTQDISNLSSGYYNVTVTDAVGQTESSTFYISEPSPITITYSVNAPSAPGFSDGSVAVNVSGGTTPYSYSWSGPNNYNASTQDIQNVLAGTYTYYVIDANGCYVLLVITIPEGQLTPLVVTENITGINCFGDNNGTIDLTVSGGATPYSFIWSNAEVTEDLSNLSSGTYTVTVTDAAGQSYTNTYVIAEPNALTATYNVTNVSISGGNDGAIDLTASGGVAPYLYYWSTGQNTEDLSNLVAGTYDVWIVDVNQCYINVIIDVNEVIYGCTDPSADNYDPTATTDDGSCIYSNSCNEDTPTNLFVNGIIHDRATINWDNMNSSVCIVDQYRIKYREVGTTSWNQKNMGAPIGSCNFGTNKTDKLILNLTANTTYEYQMKAWYCGGGSSSWTAIYNFTTLGSCPNVVNLSATPQNSTKVRFDWNLNGIYSFVRIKAREDYTGASWFNVGGVGVNYPTVTKNKNGLTPGQAYRAQARTWCDPNGGPYRSDNWSAIVFWTMPSSAKLSFTAEKQPLIITDVLGRKVNQNEVLNNTTLFYIYSDGTVEKKIIIE